MRVTDMSDKIKSLPDLPRDIFIFIFVALISLSAFLVYRIALGDSGQSVPHIKITQGTAAVANVILASSSPLTSTTVGKYVGSRSGHSYYLPSCAGVKRIKEANKVWFSNVEEATAKGYHPAAACKEMQ